MFRLRVTQQDVGRSPGTGRHRGGNRSRRRRMEVGSPDRRIGRMQEGGDQKIEPVGIRHAVRIGVGHDLAGGRLQAHVSCHGQSPVGLKDVFHQRKFRRDRLGGILGSVVDQNHLEIRIVDFLQRLQAAPEGGRPVVTANHHRDFRNARKGKFFHQTVLRSEGFLRQMAVSQFRLAVLLHQTERPILHIDSIGEPLVGPGEENRARQSPAKHLVPVQGEQGRLLLLSVPEGVHPELPQNQRAVLRQIL